MERAFHDRQWFWILFSLEENFWCYDNEKRKCKGDIFLRFYHIFVPISTVVKVYLFPVCCSPALLNNATLFLLFCTDWHKRQADIALHMYRPRVVGLYRGVGNEQFWRTSRQRAILAYEISWFLFDFPVISLKNDVMRCKSGWGWRVGLISELDFKEICFDFSWFQLDFNLISPRGVRDFFRCRTLARTLHHYTSLVYTVSI